MPSNTNMWASYVPFCQIMSFFFSSIDLPPSAASLVRLHRSSAAPGGTLVAVHKSIVSDPRVKSVVPSAQLKGYVSHVRVPLFSGHYLHLVGAYCPPSNRTLHSAVHTYLSTLATSAAESDDFVLAAGDWNSSVRLSPNTPSSFDSAFSKFLLDSGLSSVSQLSCPTASLPTFFGYTASLQLSALDDFLVSPNFASHLKSVTPPFFSTLPTAASDHVPLQLLLPSIVAPFVPPPPPPRSAHLPTLITPFSQVTALKASHAISARVDVPISLMLATCDQLCSNVITDILHGDTSSANIMAHRSRICGLVDIATIGGAVTDFAVQGFSCALQVCPLRSAPLSRRFFPRKLQGRCGRLAVTRRFLCLARTLVSTHVKNARPGSLIRTDLAQSLLNHATAQKARHVLSPTAFSDVLPPLPGDDSLPAWHLWASQCHVRLNAACVQRGTPPTCVCF